MVKAADAAVGCGQVLDAEARKTLPHTARWYQTAASQPRFSSVAGPVNLADKVRVLWFVGVQFSRIIEHEMWLSLASSSLGTLQGAR